MVLVLLVLSFLSVTVPSFGVAPDSRSKAMVDVLWARVIASKLMSEWRSRVV